MIMRRLLLLIPLILLILLTYLSFRSNIFTIKTVDVKLKNLACTDDGQISDSSKLVGQNFFFIDPSKVEVNIKKKFLCVKSLNVLRQIPNKVKLQVFGRDPAAILVVLKSEEATGSAVLEKFSEATDSARFSSSVEGPSEFFLVDTEGVIYSTTIEQINVPKIYILGQNLILGQKITEDLINNTLKILREVKTFAVDVEEAKIYSRYILLINAIPKIVFRLDDKIDIQLASLQLILNQAKIDEANLEFIDLRFDKPIVRLAPKKK